MINDNEIKREDVTLDCILNHWNKGNGDITIKGCFYYKNKDYKRGTKECGDEF